LYLLAWPIHRAAAPSLLWDDRRRGDRDPVPGWPGSPSGHPRDVASSAHAAGKTGWQP